MTAFSIFLFQNLSQKSINVLEIVPLGFGRFELHVNHEEEQPAIAKESKASEIMALDLGITNFCTAVSSDGDSFILSGCEMKNIWA